MPPDDEVPPSMTTEHVATAIVKGLVGGGIRASPVATKTNATRRANTIGTANAERYQRHEWRNPNEPRRPSRLTHRRIATAASRGPNIPGRKLRRLPYIVVGSVGVVEAAKRSPRWGMIQMAFQPHDSP